MAERNERTYSTLFEVRLFHHYWLNDGDTLFDKLADEKREHRLRNYDIAAFLDVVPTEQTEITLKACRANWRRTKSGFIVVTSGEMLIPSEIVLEWSLKVIDPNFFNYTALTLQQRSIRECYTADKSACYRFKENVPVFTNLTGASRGSGEGKMLFLSRELEERLDAGDQVESLFELDGALCQLTADQSGDSPVFQTLGAHNAAMPVYANQRDVPEIVPPEGILDTPAKGILLDDGVTDDLFALIRIAAWREDDGDFSFIDSDGHARTAPPVFQIRFKNRHTWWKWIDRKGTETLSEKPLPLTFYGNASSPKRVKPSVTAFKAEMSDEKTISQLVSEIFI